jgi:RNA polymerase sigma-70 factor (ECF subfamily)
MPKGSRKHEPEHAPIAIPSPEADELVVRARDGDVDAFAELFRASLPIVFRNLYGRTGERALTEDLTSETYLRAMRAIRTFEGGSQDFLSWTLRIARNLFLDHVKSGRVRWEVVVDEMPVSLSPHDPESEAVQSVEGIELRRALAKLTAEQQEVVYLRFLQGLSIAEVAAIVGRQEGAVKALQFRALKALGRILRESGVEAP